MDYPARYVSVPNLVTYVSIAGGFLAMSAALGGGGWALVGVCLGVSVIADMFDGTFASQFTRTERERAFGAQLDSLSDALAFGAAPVVAGSFLVTLDSTWIRVVWGASSVVYLVAVVTRLAFFNVYQGQGSRFVGLPSTMAGLVVATVYLVHPPATVLIGLWLLLGGAMVCGIGFHRRAGMRVRIVLLGWAVLVVVVHAVNAVRSV